MNEGSLIFCFCFFFFQAEDGIRFFCLSRGLGDVYKILFFHCGEDIRGFDLALGLGGVYMGRP